MLSLASDEKHDHEYAEELLPCERDAVAITGYLVEMLCAQLFLVQDAEAERLIDRLAGTLRRLERREIPPDQKNHERALLNTLLMVCQEIVRSERK